MTMLLTLLLAVSIPSAPTDRISDGAGLLSLSAHDEVARLISRVEAEQNIRLGVITFAQLDVDPKVAALRTLEDWPMGPRSVVLLVSMQPKKIYLQPGRDFQYQLDQRHASDIARDVIAVQLRNGHFEEGVLQGLSSSLRQVAMEPRSVVPSVLPSTVQLQQPPAEPLSFGAKFGLFLLASAVIFAVITLIRRAKRRARQAELDATTARPYQSPAISSVDYIPSPTPPLQPAFGQLHPRAQYALTNPPPVAGTGVVVIDHGSNNDLLTGVLIGESLSRPVSAPAPYVPPARSYSPPSTPAYEPPSHHDSGGGGSSWSSNDDSSSGGGGSSFDSGSSDSGGGGGFDSGGGGGGGSDF